MLYQKLLAGTDPYFACVSPSCAFALHCHPEIELCYCFKGTDTIVAGQKEYILTEGDLVIVNPMAPHEVKNSPLPGSLRLTIEIGPAFLGEQFTSFVSANRDTGILSLKQNVHLRYYDELSALLEETAMLLEAKEPFSNLLVKGNIYKISAILLKLFTENTLSTPTQKSTIDVEKIGMAVNMIYNCYNKPLSLDEVSAHCGYSKSNFCKLFKEITGESFHVLLNRHRVDVACLRLRNTEASVEEIALSVGFADSKSFCRVFKKIIGKNTGEYRKTQTGDTK